MKKKPPSKPDILQYANLEIWEPNVCFLRWFDAEPDPDDRPSNWKEQMKKGSTINPKFTKMHIEIQNGPSNKKVQAKNIIKSKKSFFFHEIAFLAVLNFFPVQKLIFDHF